MCVSLRACLALLLAAASGCSLVFVKGPPAPPVASDVPLSCTVSRVAPGADLAVGALATGLGFALLVDSSRTRPCTGWGCLGAGPAQSAEQISGMVLLGAGVAGLISSAVGYQRTGQCRDLTASRLTALGGGVPALDRLGEPAPPFRPRPGLAGGPVAGLAP